MEIGYYKVEHQPPLCWERTMKLLSEVPKDRLSQEEDEIIKGEVSEVAIRRALFHYFNEVIGHEDPEELTEDTIEDFITYIKEHT